MRGATLFDRLGGDCRLIDEALKIMEEGIVPHAKSQKGFRAGYLLTDRKTGKSVAAVEAAYAPA